MHELKLVADFGNDNRGNIRHSSGTASIQVQ